VTNLKIKKNEIMKKSNLIVLVILTLIPCIISAQDFMTIGEVFDFEIGDEFQFEGRGLNEPPNADRITIIDKYYSADSSTIFYIRYHDSYYVYIENNVAHYHFWTETDTVYYSDLNTPINQSTYWVSSDTTMVNYILINTWAEEYCDSLTNGYFYTINIFEPVNYSKLYGKGLGLVRDYYNNPAEYTMFDNELFYYQKNGVGCGVPDTTTVSILEIKLSKNFNVFPNPTHDFLNIENKKNIEVGSIIITNTTGKKIKQFDSNVNKLNVSDLTSGIYFLRINSEKGVLTKKIIIE
jgi:hypothetical protein